jgi:HEAT repeat protein
VQRAAGSPDPEVRRWALAALAETGSPAAHKDALLGALDDPEPAVVRAAAEALLRPGIDCARELGPGSRALLQAHVDAVRQDWEAVARIGPAALPALFRASRSDAKGVREGAKRTLRRLLAPYVPIPDGEDRPGEAGAAGS